jgi:hypothetical protein
VEIRLNRSGISERRMLDRGQDLTRPKPHEREAGEAKDQPAGVEAAHNARSLIAILAAAAMMVRRVANC